MQDKKIILNDFQNKKFELQGYVVIDFIDDNILSKLIKLNQSFTKNITAEGLVIGAIQGNAKYKEGVATKITSTLDATLNEIFENFEVYSASFIYKNPYTLSDFPPHQDNNLIDEEKHISLNCWIPLCDITINNGPVYILPGSHFPNNTNYRGPNINYYYKDHPGLVFKYAKPILVKKGQALIINHSVIHFSTANFTNRNRNVILLALTTKKATPIMCSYNQNTKEIIKYQMNSDLKYEYEKYHYDRNETPNGKIIERFYYSNNTLPKNELKILFDSFLIKSNTINNKYQLQLYLLTNTVRYIIYQIKKTFFRLFFRIVS